MSSDQVKKRLLRAKTSLERINRSPYPHQLKGIEWMLQLEENGSGGLLCDDPGLGKTYQALSLITSSAPTDCCLIIVPCGIIEQWRLAAVELVGKKSVYLQHGPKRAYQCPCKRVIITTYDLVRDEIEDYRRYHWDRIILDEAHKIRNSSTITSKEIRRLKGTYKWCLTGSPIQNKQEDLTNLFRFVKSSRKTLIDSELINSHLMRRTIEEVLGDKIPKLEVEISEISFISERERRFYERVQNNVRQEFSELMALGGDPKDENVAMFELLLRLRQAAQHPQLVLNGFNRKFMKDKGVCKKDKQGNKLTMKPYQGSSSKHIALIKMLKDEGLPALVFCHFREEIEILEGVLQTQQFSVARFDGKTSHQDRATLIRNLTRDDFTPPQVLLIQISAGGVGLNLQRYARVYLMSADWNPSNEIQAIGRAYRIGQTQQVKVRRLVLTDPKGEFSVIDGRISEIQMQKRRLMSDLLDEPQLKTNGVRRRFNLDRGEFRRLLM